MHPYRDRIVDLDRLAAETAELRRLYGLTYSVVLAHGCWDLLHAGHVRHLAEAASLGRLLVVTVTPDAEVREAKGAGRPVVEEDARLEMLASLRFVWRVALCPGPTAVDAIAAVRPDVYVKGGEYRGKETTLLALERIAVTLAGGRLHFTAPGPTCTTNIIRAIKGAEPLAGRPGGGRA